MTPQERRLVEELFERLATLEGRPREFDAEQVIMAGLRKAPNATYALVQTVLLQEEALKKADERIRELEGGEAYPPQQESGFLDSMRDAVFGSRPRSSVPPTGGDRPMGVPPGFRTGSGTPPNEQYAAQMPPQQPQASAGGSFLGTAAAAAVGVIGGTMLMNSMRGMLGSSHAANSAPATAADLPGSGTSPNPWGGGDASSSDLARQAGLDHMGQSGSGAGSGSGNRAGLFDQSDGAEEPYNTAEGGYEDDGGFDLGDADFG
jgi:hypothetical protein